ncbi:glycosyltransferase family 2 protein [Halomonas sp. EGI 63088]|uniref:Glycosyltransferase family 2 protein n=1 Tax=Halomonas flagellata TaxID=2920385 RepID=A0ABS9RXY3_9GAMM|nr:glycosyltransferase family 2 protein [Halomonas flagellata]MCH4564685.1 glycosyltransferase family 2 protein [Halomonas flagellata]
MLELDIESEVMRGLAELDVETAKGRFSVSLPLRPGSRSKRLVFIPLGVKRITMTLLDAHGRFRLTRLRWVWLTPWFAHDRLARRLANVLPAYRGMSVGRVKRALHRESVARGLSWRQLALAEYTQSFWRACANRHYPYWVEEVEPVRCRAWLAGRALEALKEQPTLSLLLPLDDAIEQVGIEGLRQSLASLQAQSYPRWELCVVHSPALDAQLVGLVAECLGEDPRSRLLEGHQRSLAGLTHQAFVASCGEGVMTFSAGDTLAPAALERVVRAWNDFPASQLFYADQDEIDASGRRLHPCFKPRWNPDLLKGTGYLGRFAVYRRRLLWQLESYRDIGRQCRERLSAEELDHAMALRFLAWTSGHADTAELPVCHLPGVLYHRHVNNRHAGAARSEVTVSLVGEFVARLGKEHDVTVEPGLLPGSARLRWPVAEPAPLVSLLVPTRDGIDILKPCVEAILERTDYRHFELLILDNQSRCPETLAYLEEVARRDSRVRVLRWDQPFNYSAINNFGVRQARGEILGLINNDVEPVDGGWLTEMVSQARRPEIGCVGAKLYYPNDMLQHAGVVLGLGGVAGHVHRFFPRQDAGYCGRLKLVQNLSAVTAACLLVRRAVFEAVGGLNEADLAVAYNDVDLCIKVREAGYRNLWTPHAELYHHESVSRGADDTPEKHARWMREMAYMKRTWGEKLRDDPAYNPNLTLVHEDFSLR